MQDGLIYLQAEVTPLSKVALYRSYAPIRPIPDKTLDRCNKLLLQCLMFEWDEVKRLENLDERGVDFRLAAQIFLNPPFLEAEDTREDYGETRYRAMGSVDGETYLVSYTWRGRNRRIITAWRLDDYGKERYTQILSRRPESDEG